MICPLSAANKLLINVANQSIIFQSYPRKYDGSICLLIFSVCCSINCLVQKDSFSYELHLKLAIGVRVLLSWVLQPVLDFTLASELVLNSVLMKD